MMSPPTHVDLPRLGRVCRLGLATRGGGQLDCEAVLAAIDRGVNYLNWCGYPDGMRDAIRLLGPRRHQVFIAVQLDARIAHAAQPELAGVLADLSTDYLDVVTYYYIEHEDEWQEIIGPGGAAEVIEEARRKGKVRAIGLTGHQRPLMAETAASGRLDFLMARYNAAHRGAERKVFPIATERRVPIIAFTCLRWGALLQPTSDDPPGFIVPRAPDWYRFVLREPAVAVALMAPDNTSELVENLEVLDDWRGLGDEAYQMLLAHGDRVRRHVPSFP